ncbi:syntaxin-132 isoform X1 [Physcomitrium patens]|uniref:syntaxin-132 isoform X1 n=1 Tax=Physcomitrium patens TaxID=3218 RepID=UPI000D1528A2|nr:syntaxin-132-like isoform X3 [Physcomitrium patens]|eukprot:XP_024370526.1 syntaxin-132-like isoform X3 [Physcomitrella patens]
MNDLLADKDSSANEKEEDLEAGPSPVPEAGQDLSLFFQEVNDIKSSMAEIRKRFQKLQNTNEESKSVTKAANMTALKEKMEHDLDEISKVAQGLKGKIEAMDKANLVNRKIKGCHEGSSTDRTRMAITSTLKKKLKELMVDFQAIRRKFQVEYREVVERRVFTVTGQKVDESVIERLIDSGDGDQIFQKAIQEQGRGQILDTVAEIQERHDAVRDIEKKLLELHQIFLDMAVLVEAQGDLLDNIETQVGKAVDHIASGTTALQKAKSLQRGTRKCMCIGIVVLLVTIVIIIVSVIQPWKNAV